MEYADAAKASIAPFKEETEMTNKSKEQAMFEEWQRVSINEVLHAAVEEVAYEESVDTVTYASQLTQMVFEGFCSGMEAQSKEPQRLQPMSTAPRDGTEILVKLTYDGFLTGICMKYPDGRPFVSTTEGGLLFGDFKGWMPVPEGVK